ncbi:MAG: hypothetical protein M5T61_09250 [Acidimicrobiia bacterium]|nr:hypothetical protein [Acidimicrobiia bacterium]
MVDGNKRLGWVALRLFYAMNEADLRAKEEAAFELVVAVADGQLRDVADIAERASARGAPPPSAELVSPQDAAATGLLGEGMEPLVLREERHPQPAHPQPAHPQPAFFFKLTPPPHLGGWRSERFARERSFRT